MTSLVAREAVPLAPVDLEPEFGQALGHLLELGQARKLQGRMSLPRRSKPIVDTHVNLGCHPARVVEGSKPHPTFGRQILRLVNFGHPEAGSVEPSS
jgi:hypothetical protein